MICSMAFADVVLPLSVIFSFIQILVLSIAMLFILEPLSIVETSINIGGFAGALSRSVLVLPNINCAIGQINLRDLGGIWIEFGLEYSALGEVILALASLLVLEVVTLKEITIIVLELPMTVFETLFEVALEEDLPVFE